MDERQPIVLSVHQCGTPQFPRWTVSDQYLRYFDGEGGWTEDEAKAVRFATSNEACVEAQRLLMIPYMDLPVRKFRSHVYLDLFCAHDIPEIEIKRWLHKVAKLLIDSPRHGNGPVEGSLGITRIEWSELKEVKDEGSV